MNEVSKMNMDTLHRKAMEESKWRSQRVNIMNNFHMNRNKLIGTIVDKITKLNKKHNKELVKKDVERIVNHEIVRCVNIYRRNKHPEMKLDFKEVMEGKLSGSATECCVLINESNNVIHNDAAVIAKKIKKLYNVSVEDEIRFIYELKTDNENKEIDPAVNMVMVELISIAGKYIKCLLVKLVKAGALIAIILYILYKLL